jgi:hypothetical protein
MLEDNSHIEDEAFADCVTILGKFYEFHMTIAPFEVVSGSSVYL